MKYVLRVELIELKIRLKYITNKPKSQKCTIIRPKSLPRYVFKADIGDSFYMDDNKLWNHKLDIFYMQPTYAVGGCVFESKIWYMYV
jgi:hypothetical protein